jgi:hypothetical protein
VDPVLLAELEEVEETHPPTIDTVMRLLAAVVRRDKHRIFINPVTDAVVRGDLPKPPADVSSWGWGGRGMCGERPTPSSCIVHH